MIPIHIIMLPRPLSEAGEFRFNGVDTPIVPAGSTLLVNRYDGEIPWHPRYVGLLFPRDLGLGWSPSIARFLGIMRKKRVALAHAGVLSRLLSEKSLLSNELKPRRTLFGGTVFKARTIAYIDGLVWSPRSREWSLEHVPVDAPLNGDEPFLVDCVHSSGAELVL